MEITLEKIELVKDRTGVSYKEAKDALTQTDGNVVDAIILIEEQIDVAPRNSAETTASKIVEDLKELVSKGNVTKILVKRDDQIVLNIPVNVGILGAVLVPWAVVLSAVAALGLRCNISIVKSDGEVVDVVEKAASKFSSVKENYSSVADDLREKGSEAVSKVKEKADSVKSKVGSMDLFEEDDDLFDVEGDSSEVEVTRSADDSIEESFEEAVSEFKSRIADTAEHVESDVKSIIDELINDDAEFSEGAEYRTSELEDLLAEAEKAGAEAEDALKGAQDALEDAVETGEEKFESTIQDLQEKKKRFRFFN